MRWVATALGAAGIALALTACEGAPREGNGGPPAVGGRAPAFAAVTMDGDSLSLEDLRGSPVLLNLWATWCAPCRFETPYLQSIHERFGPRGLRTVGITVDGRNAVEDVESFLEEMGVSYTILHDPGMRSLDVFSVIGLPATFVLDAQGRFRFTRTGPVMEGDEAFEGVLEEVVEEEG